jgi:hypothetical protein
MRDTDLLQTALGLAAPWVVSGSRFDAVARRHLRLAEHGRTGWGKNQDPHTRTTAAAQPARSAPCHHRQAVRPPRAVCPMPLLQAQVPARL